jgi:hypothetical protein
MHADFSKEPADFFIEQLFLTAQRHNTKDQVLHISTFL